MREPSPGWEERVRSSFDRQRMMTATLGARITDLQPGRVTLQMDRRSDLTQQHGFIHAGATATLADSACGYAAYSLAQPGWTVLTVEFKINLLAPAAGARLTAVGRVVRSGRTLTVCTAEVTSEGGDGSALVAQMQATIMLLPGDDG